MAETRVQPESHVNNETVEEQCLSDAFDKCLEVHCVVDESDSTSEKYKNDVNWAVSKLEEITKKVNMLNLFSRNETIDEVATADIKYLLLPALLGSFTMKKSISRPEERNEILSLSELYFSDYLQRLKDYEVSKIDRVTESSLSNDILSNGAVTLPPNLVDLAKHRESKISRFKKLKALHEREKDLHNAMKSNTDDEVAREYYVTLLKKWAFIASEEIENISMEKEVLQHFSQSVSLSHNNARSQEKPKSLKPVIITRNELQKELYGLGYPSVPIMTVDEFYQQRYPENTKSGPSPAAEMNNLMYIAANPDFHKKELEKEDEEKERKVENDDPELLQHTRAFDDWKDVNRRGCGNRKNKG